MNIGKRRRAIRQEISAVQQVLADVQKAAKPGSPTIAEVHAAIKTVSEWWAYSFSYMTHHDSLKDWRKPRSEWVAEHNTPEQCSLVVGLSENLERVEYAYIS